MKCQTCNRPVTESDKSYGCDCVTVPKKILGKIITPEIALELIINRRTKFMDGFISKRNNKPFRAALVIKDKRAAFEFEERKGEENKDKGDSSDKGGNGEDAVSIRIHSENSGTAHVTIKGAIYKDFQISYGHVSSRMAECLATLTAANLIKYTMGNINGVKLDISLNNLDFSRYILKERTPRDRDIKLALEVMFKLLAEFGGWCARFKPEKRPKLTGSPQSNNFPKGVFPGLDLEVAEENGMLKVTLPGTPDIQAQFTASIQRAMPDGDKTYTIPLTVRPVLMAWINSVKRG